MTPHEQEGIDRQHPETNPSGAVVSSPTGDETGGRDCSEEKTDTVEMEAG